MSSAVEVKNTLAFLFPMGAAQPTLEEMARFVKTLAADKANMESAYKIADERSVFVKFKNEAAVKKALIENGPKHFFHYSNGKVVEVCMSIAGGNVRYVRIFDLPPEVNDRDISLVLEQYGKIKRQDREKFPLNLGLGDLFTGVHGVHMDIEKDIPPILQFVGRKGRLYHDQMIPRCYVCLSEGHFKAACPNKKARHRKSTKQNGDVHTYADVAARSSSEINDKVEQEKENGEEEESVANAATTNSAVAQETEEEILIEEEFEDDLAMDESTMVPITEETNEKTAWDRLAHVVQSYKKTKEREEQAEEQRQQRKKSVTRTKRGSISPPTKKKY